MRRAFLLAAVGAALSFAGGADSASAPSFVIGPCPVEFDTTHKVDCGTIQVPENRSNPNSRMITVSAAIVHATSKHPKADPIVYQNGGPSFPTLVPWAMEVFDGTTLPDDRDVILIDQRGEGSSVPRFFCPELNQADREDFFAKPYIGAGAHDRYQAAIKACYDRWTATGADLSGYNSAETVTDMEALRKALGIKQWNIWFISADGVIGTTYLRLYPSSIRSAVLDSPQSNTMKIGLDYLRGHMQLLEKALAGCAANTACNAKYPNLRSVLYAYVADLNRHPAQFFVTVGGRKIKVLENGATFLKDEASEVLPWSVQDVFSEIWRSAHGELQQVIQDQFGDELPTFTDWDDVDFGSAYGKTMSYLCHDVVGFETQADFNQLAADYPPLAPWIFDPFFDYMFGKTACDVWTNGLADPAQHNRFNSPVPTLITIGEYDGDGGVTPNISREIAASLPNSYTVEFPATGHIPLYPYPGDPIQSCAQSIVTQFLAMPTKRPDGSCIATLPQMDFTP